MSRSSCCVRGVAVSMVWLNALWGAEAQPTPPPATPLPEMAVTATRSASPLAGLPYAVEVIGAGDLARQMPLTMPDALEGVSGVMTQKTSSGQTSPYIRGFTGFRNLLLVDGIRLNNSTFRDGPNQYWTMVDAWSLERLELVRGPAGVVFGSDAVGGTVNAITLPTGLSLSPNTWERHLYLRGGSADGG